MSIWGDIQIAQQRKEQHYENSARFANIYLNFETTGTGQLRIPEIVEGEEVESFKFPIPFFEKPALSYGSSITRVADPTIFRFPLTWAGVAIWDQNERGFYIGAHFYFIVECEVLEGATFRGWRPPSPVVQHTLTFSASAYKKMSDEVNSELIDGHLPTNMPPSSG